MNIKIQVKAFIAVLPSHIGDPIILGLVAGTIGHLKLIHILDGGHCSILVGKWLASINPSCGLPDGDIPVHVGGFFEQHFPGTGLDPAAEGTVHLSYILPVCQAVGINYRHPRRLLADYTLCRIYGYLAGLCTACKQFIVVTQIAGR